ncbi:hypothetical protein ACLOJK_028774 [Asimina triloba]
MATLESTWETAMIVGSSSAAKHVDGGLVCWQWLGSVVVTIVDQDTVMKVVTGGLSIKILGDVRSQIERPGMGFDLELIVSMSPELMPGWVAMNDISIYLDTDLGKERLLP